MIMIEHVATGTTLIRLSAPSPIKGEGHGAASSQSGLLPLWEKVAECRMRGEPLAENPEGVHE